jgi:hypothetical protein
VSLRGVPMSRMRGELKMVVLRRVVGEGQLGQRACHEERRGAGNQSFASQSFRCH